MMTTNKYAALSTQHQYKIGLKLIDSVSISNAASILDIGCGTGELASLLADKVAKGMVLAIDPDTERISFAKNHNSRPNLHWQVRKIEDLIGEEAKFDFAFANFSFHWIADKKAALKTVQRCLKPGGHFAMTVVTRIPTINEIIFQMSGQRGVELKNAVPLLANEWWLNLSKEVGFKIVSAAATEGFTFANLDEYLGWWEASSQGHFRINMLSQADKLHLQHLYPQTVTVYDDGSLMLVAEKP